MNNENLQNYVNIVSNNIKKNLKTISSIIYHYDIQKILDEINDVPKENIDNILEMCINNCLDKIKNYHLSLEQYKLIERDVDEFIDFYTKDNLEEIIEEACVVSYDLIMKVTNHNERNINLPIKIDFIKTFCINNMIKNDNIDTTILYIVLYLTTFCYCLENNDYKAVKK